MIQKQTGIAGIVPETASAEPKSEVQIAGKPKRRITEPQHLKD